MEINLKLKKILICLFLIKKYKTNKYIYNYLYHKNNFKR